MPNGLDAKVNGSVAPRKQSDAPLLGSSNGGAAVAAHAEGDGDAALSGLAAANLPFVEELYFQFLNDPASVDPTWRRTFQGLNGNGAGLNGGAGAAAMVPPAAFRRSIFASAGAPVVSGAGIAGSRMSVRLLSERVQRLVEGYRELGHLTANLDPLGLMRRKLPPIALEDFGLAEEDPDLVFSSENVAGPDRTTLRELVGLLRETYCRTIGVELAHLHDVELRSWLQSRMEATRNRLALARDDRLQLLDKVIDAEVFEQFLQNKFLGDKRFSLEGAESLIPLLELLIERAARSASSRSSSAWPTAGGSTCSPTCWASRRRDLRRVRGQGRSERSVRRRRREVPPRLLDRSNLRVDRDRPGRTTSTSRWRSTRATSSRSTRWCRAACAPSRTGVGDTEPHAGACRS